MPQSCWPTLRQKDLPPSRQLRHHRHVWCSCVLVLLSCCWCWQPEEQNSERSKYYTLFKSPAWAQEKRLASDGRKGVRVREKVWWKFIRRESTQVALATDTIAAPMVTSQKTARCREVVIRLSSYLDSRGSGEFCKHFRKLLMTGGVD